MSGIKKFQIRGLSKSTSKEQLRKAFSGHGRVISSKVSHGLRGQGVGSVVFVPNEQGNWSDEIVRRGIEVRGKVFPVKESTGQAKRYAFSKVLDELAKIQQHEQDKSELIQALSSGINLSPRGGNEAFAVLELDVVDDWTATEFREFIAVVEKQYNFLYALSQICQNAKNLDRNLMAVGIELMLNDRWPIPIAHRLRISEIEIHSPGKISFEGLGDLFERIWNRKPISEVYGEKAKQAELETEILEQKAEQERIRTEALRSRVHPLPPRPTEGSWQKLMEATEPELNELEGNKLISSAGRRKLTTGASELDRATEEFRIKMRSVDVRYLPRQRRET